MNWYFDSSLYLKKAKMWSADHKKVFKGLDFENPADTRLFYGTIWNIYIYIFFNNPFLTVLLGCFENVL